MAAATDDFNRADNASLGANWASREGGAEPFKILTNQCLPTDYVSADRCSYYIGTAFSPNQFAEVAVSGIAGTGGASGIGLAVRCLVNPDLAAANRTFYRVVVSAAASNNVSVAKKVADVFTALGTRTQAFSDGDILRFSAYGSTLQVHRNGVQLGADFIDGSIGVGAPGVAYSTTLTAGALDNWVGGDYLRPFDFSQFPKAKLRPAVPVRY